MMYAYGSVIASVFIFWIFFRSFNSQLQFSVPSIQTLPDEVIEKVRNALAERHLYRQQNLTLADFSAEVEIPQYLVTRCVKHLYQRSFPETLNYFRVEELKTLLASQHYQHLKIESLAYEVGFSSPSSFYAAFKKLTGVNPKDYQKPPGLQPV